MSDPSEKFPGRVEDLVAQFEKLVDRGEWITRRYPKRLRDDSRAIYEVPSLFLQKGPIRLFLDPIGYDPPGAEGAADIYQMPSYDPAATLYFEGGQWLLYYACPPDTEPEILSLSAETINQVLDSVAEHAVPSY